MATLVTTAPGIGKPGVSRLKAQLRRAERKRKLQAVGLVLPLFLFIVVTFIVPMVVLMFRSVDNPEIVSTLPNTVAALEDWDGEGIPDEPVFAALAADLKQTQKDKTTGLVGKRINHEIAGARSKIIGTARKIEKLETGPYKQAFLDANDIWGEREAWVVLKRAGNPYTTFYLAASVDLVWNADNELVQAPPDQSLFRSVFLRTFGISITVTLATLLLGFPVAYLLATLPTRTSNLLMILVLLPFWTSLLVRTTAWVVLLQTEGVINDLLVWTGILGEPVQLIFNRFGTIVAMTHIQLPFTILPIYSVMKTIPPSHVRAARSLGAGPFYAFWRVYFPQTIPGIGAGCLLTFILSLGYYITPALVGGPTDQMVSYFVALYTNTELNWGMASALGIILLALTMVLYFVYNRLVGIDKMKLG
ncbi:MAG: polyamine ABC transporter substrate-binding protein [Alphaproteobacteria bacterium]|nr:MAG: polyamine ABC transporter substrate-binding protein [Alphaproteobacteria bacterium]